MQLNVRKSERIPCRSSFTISWEADGLTRSAEAEGIDISQTGVGILCPVEVRPGIKVYIEGAEDHLAGYSFVRHCTPRGSGYFIGLELNEGARKPIEIPSEDDDYYDFLQISRRAEPATITRIYHFLARRYHPDNPETGDSAKFLLLNRAYKVLSDPERRAEYDKTLESAVQASPAFESVDFMDDAEGESNRRLAVVSLLYRRCRANVDNPKVTLREMETLMAFPREYLNFTIWYLRRKHYITVEDNSDFALTVLGVDYVESNFSKLPLLRKMLGAGAAHHTAPDTETSNPADSTRDAVFIAASADEQEDEAPVLSTP